MVVVAGNVIGDFGTKSGSVFVFTEGNTMGDEGRKGEEERKRCVAPWLVWSALASAPERLEDWLCIEVVVVLFLLDERLRLVMVGHISRLVRPD